MKTKRWISGTIGLLLIALAVTAILEVPEVANKSNETITLINDKIDQFWSDDKPVVEDAMLEPALTNRDQVKSQTSGPSLELQEGKS